MKASELVDKLILTIKVFGDHPVRLQGEGEGEDGWGYDPDHDIEEVQPIDIKDDPYILLC